MADAAEWKCVVQCPLCGKKLTVKHEMEPLHTHAQPGLEGLDVECPGTGMQGILTGPAGPHIKG